MHARMFGRDGTATIAVINKSSVVKANEVKAAVAAIQVQVTRDFAPAWGVGAKVIVASEPPPGAWVCFILDNSDEAGALGYHDLNKSGVPVTRVFAKTDLKYGLKWPVTLSHEVLEMIADPCINITVQHGGVFYSYESADPVEDDDMGYIIDGVPVSNFIYPEWFVPFLTRDQTKFDHAGVLTKAFEIGHGGYSTVFDIHTKRWHDLHPGEMGRRLKSKREKTGGRTQIRKARPING